MFPFRRQGPKKRNKTNNPRQKARGPQRALPNSARDMALTVQQATKALAQMLAGRTRPSGQLAHAQSVLAHAERLIDDRQHNRLNPSEREEFFEQLARLRLTIADAESEAMVAEEEIPKPPPAPVDQERLRAMALALSRPEPAADEVKQPDGRAGHGPEEREEPGAVVVADDAAPAAEPVAVSRANARSGRLQLTRTNAEQAVDALNEPLTPARARRLRPRPTPAPDVAPTPETTATTATASSAPPESPAAGNGARKAPRRLSVQAPTNGNAAAPETAAATATSEDDSARYGAPDGTLPSAGRPRRGGASKGLPEGWVIDDEGFVVPGPR